MLVVGADAQTLRSELQRAGRRRDVVDPIHNVATEEDLVKMA